MKYTILVALCVGALVWIGFFLQPAVNTHDAIVLCNYCPPGFELTEDNRCILRNLYQQYELADELASGVGGLKSPLPKGREGFSPQQIDLGRYLFFDPVLSLDGTISCATCHDPDKGFSDGLATSMGIHKTPVSRAAPSLWNVSFLKRFFWDGRANSLEQQMQGPLYAANEMGTSPEQLSATLNSIVAYKTLFAQAFPSRTSSTIELSEVYTCIAAFESSLISLNSRYDQYAHGYHAALNKDEIEGLNVFRSFVARCAECHTPPLFTNQQLAVIGVAEPTGQPLDPGAEEVFHDKTLRAAFKVPSLRNIEKTAPYTHAGRFSTLREMVEFYTLGRGHEVPEGENLHIHWHIWEPQLSAYELDRLVDFLNTLTDESFIPKPPDRIPSGIELRKSSVLVKNQTKNLN